MTTQNTKPKLKIGWATHEAAKYACENWHYSKCIPKNKLFKIGVWEDNIFVGVVLFGYGATQHLGKPYNLTMQQCCELVRIALKKHINPVSKMLSISLKFLKKHNPGIKLVVSFADSTQGHHGGIYQATNWLYTGKTASAVFYRDPTGKLWHPRRASKNKILGKRLVTKEWKEELQGSKYRYIFPLCEETKKTILHLAKPYPKRVEHESNASNFQLEESGAVPTNTLHLGGN